jgi:hypothetical protein
LGWPILYEDFFDFLATPCPLVTYYSRWIAIDRVHPLSMAHNVLDLVGGSDSFSFHYRVASIRHTHKDSASPSSSHHQFELKDFSIPFVDWEMLALRSVGSTPTKADPH